ncbi:hypothetical protein SNK03_002906 [Fusarium graminearum]|uniref:Chromosome 1, complete genome n=1 Tax=Gibberella zeae (strain ATCC MYA-4620 / CBS 123657 / FGSC 9075 / NRRL 31084 / PH-1) TaxID=229533 RepID=I1S5N4_GIBZE|nr:hypothetical protein FGSG_12155 [Fusarium graminearum PH-1]ESU07982.1 hypothetical protein FGSG_12155 [Fusarium graminearum PH-1]CEF74842.1 unnamed protein product [Fusarium graminearum]CZS78120.1 unnamed protein product [Fusarium graminearum]|eukprot:XP_011318467.1 hypothetical protein FGSG_12155 [Fusarium graminearum PH-1]
MATHPFVKDPEVQPSLFPLIFNEPFCICHDDVTNSILLKILVRMTSFILPYSHDNKVLPTTAWIQISGSCPGFLREHSIVVPDLTARPLASSGFCYTPADRLLVEKVPGSQSTGLDPLLIAYYYLVAFPVPLGR